jgi:hypothetical protein
MQDSEEQEEARKLYESYEGMVLPNDEPIHEQLWRVLKDVMCLPSQEIGHHHWACIMQKCKNVPPLNVMTLTQSAGGFAEGL